MIADIQVESQTTDEEAERYGVLAQVARAQGLVYAEATAQEIEALGRRSAAVKCDVSDRDQVAATVARVVEELGSLDILVNNAGTLDHLAQLRDQSPELWERDLRVNLTGAFNCCQAVWPHMVERGFGRIVNVTSSSGKRPSSSNMSYSVGKAAQLSLSRAFADLYAKRGVLVNSVAPGPVESGLWMDEGGLLDQLARVRGASREETLKRQSAGVPIGRYASEEEIASVIVFLCSERASYVAGAAWSVDGGTVQVII